MKTIKALLITLIVSHFFYGYSQRILNGSFELNTAATDKTNISNFSFNSFMQDVYAFGTASQIDIIKSETYCGKAIDGDFFLGLAHRSQGGTVDALSLTLSRPLIQGTVYTLSYYDRGCVRDFSTGGVPLEIGVSLFENSFGSSVYVSPFPLDSVWTKRIFSFVAPNNGQYITIRASGLSSGFIDWIHIDNFEFVCSFDLDLGKDTSLCEGKYLQLEVPVSGAEYLWQDGSNLSFYKVDKPGIYSVEVTFDNCSSFDQIKVSYDTLPTRNFTRDTSLFSNDSLVLNYKSDGMSKFLWQDSSSDSIYIINNSGTYICKVTKDYCFRKDTVTVQYVNYPDVSLGNDTTLCFGDSIVFDLSSLAQTFIWQDSSSLSYYVINNPGIYSVECANANCSVKSEVNIKYKYCCSDFLLPNLITINDDGKNDTFIIGCLNIPDWNIEIYNRWGEKIYEDSDYKNNWSGYGNNEGIYYYRLTNSHLDYDAKGWVEIVR